MIHGGVSPLALMCVWVVFFRTKFRNLSVSSSITLCCFHLLLSSHPLFLSSEVELFLTSLFVDFTRFLSSPLLKMLFHLPKGENLLLYLKIFFLVIFGVFIKLFLSANPKCPQIGLMKTQLITNFLLLPLKSCP